MGILNIIAYCLIIIFVLVVVLGVWLVNKGQDRKYFLTELKIIVTLLIMSFVGLGISLVILGYLGEI
ncbi:hypothetical protein ASS77_10130 [Staphylococcus saprophyticus]|uniref:Uncharacterized protein n=2 Tax=Staphylococcus TaxID=1279 RepID=Q49UM6_STAS1|nr:hypothetical protein [Staphylococcus saprophyticus]OFK24554.1 hypothetical protein HMPREF2825_10190 [Staphylococcus sp. HMSC068H12]OOC98273.1 hypothetical protein BWO95_04420 [Staphylococcus saprophyticus subsp. saprophyticus ATCC 15305 = NCTC 7292]KIJ86665.1 hypothetical protein SE00_08980 [Staphylococcus saprophyticus]OEK13041.1 hypothetical protein ASS79_00890 [Staphylococcus saprophyticus]OEK13917.1 hypothetical protein ASS77_10130 [Staphylococcus saprophyticus]